VEPEGNGTPSGEIAVEAAGAECTLAAPEGECEITIATAGSWTIAATYRGDGNFLGGQFEWLVKVEPEAAPLEDARTKAPEEPSDPAEDPVDPL
jgi:hypothetical protein